MALVSQQDVVSVQAVDLVVPRPAADHVGAGRPQQDVVAGGPQDGALGEIEAGADVSSQGEVPLGASVVGVSYDHDGAVLLDRHTVAVGLADPDAGDHLPSHAERPLQAASVVVAGQREAPQPSGSND